MAPTYVTSGGWKHTTLSLLIVITTSLKIRNANDFNLSFCYPKPKDNTCIISFPWL